MAKTRGLGRGLDALIPVLPEGGEELRRIKIKLIRPNARQPRETWEEAGIQELAASIKEHGLLQPIVVRPAGEGYELVAGERRWRACRLLGWETVPALIREYDDEKTACAILVENIQREDLNPLEEAIAYQRLIEEFRLTHEEAARRVGRSRAAVGNALRLLSLPPRVLQMLRKGDLSAGHARALLAVSEPAIQEEIAVRAAAQQLSVRDVEAVVRRWGKAKDDKSPAKETAVTDEGLAEATEKISSTLGTKVAVRPSRRRWRVEIYFRSREEIMAFAKRFTLKKNASRET
ncbi:MAG: ParB/RepB/Spo0J family partition protein [Bacillota bacterium]